MFSKFARVVPPVRCTWLVPQRTQVRWMERLSRPREMDTVRYTGETRVWRWGVVGAIVFTIVTGIQAIDIFSRWRHYERNADTYADYERMQKAGVFMSVRPDGSYRQFMKRERTYESAPYIEGRDEDGNLVYKEDMLTAFNQVADEYKKKPEAERRAQGLNSELNFLSIQAVRFGSAEEFSKNLAAFEGVKEEFLAQESEVDLGEAGMDHIIYKETYKGDSERNRGIVEAFQEEADKLMEIYEEDLKSRGLRTYNTWDFDPMVLLTHQYADPEATQERFLALLARAPANIRARLNPIVDRQ